MIAIPTLAAVASGMTFHQCLLKFFSAPPPPSSPIICTHCVEGQPSVMVVNWTNKIDEGCSTAGDHINGEEYWQGCYPAETFQSWGWTTADTLGSLVIQLYTNDTTFTVSIYDPGNCGLAFTNVTLSCNGLGYLCGLYHLTNDVGSADVLFTDCSAGAPSTNGMCEIYGTPADVLFGLEEVQVPFFVSSYGSLEWANSIHRVTAMPLGSNSWNIGASISTETFTAMGTGVGTLSCAEGQLCGTVNVNGLSSVGYPWHSYVTFGVGTGCP